MCKDLVERNVMMPKRFRLNIAAQCQASASAKAIRTRTTSTVTDHETSSEASIIIDLVKMPREVSDIKRFIEICRRKDASCEYASNRSDNVD